MATVDNDDLPMLSTAILRRLNEQATLKLAEITRTGNSSRNVTEINAAKDLLSKSMQSKQR